MQSIKFKFPVHSDLHLSTLQVIHTKLVVIVLSWVNVNANEISQAQLKKRLSPAVPTQ